jgi:hypothetical protein
LKVSSTRAATEERLAEEVEQQLAEDEGDLPAEEAEERLADDEEDLPVVAQERAGRL